MGSAAFDYSVYCDRCGEAYTPKKPVCTGCGAAPARHWLQLTSLMVFVLAALCNSLVCWFLLPRLVSVRNAQVFRGWLWFDEKASLYGWAPIILGILAWDYFIWRRSRRARQVGHKNSGGITRKLLKFVFGAPGNPLIPRGRPAGKAPDSVLSRLQRPPGVPSSL